MRRLVPFVAVLAALGGVLAPVASAALRPFHLRPGLKVQALAAGPKDTVWAAGLERTKAGPRTFVTWFGPGGEHGFVDQPAPAGSTGVGDLVEGPEGRMWFSVPAENAVVRTGPEGHWQGLHMAEGGLPAGLLTVGDDVWATLPGQALISRIEPPAPRKLTWTLEPETSLDRAVLGSDGKIWAASATAPELVEVDPETGDSRYYRFSEGDPGIEDTVFTQLVAGANGTFWVTESGRGLVGKIRRRKGHSGFEEIRTMLPGGPTKLLADGPAGDLWFATARGKVGSISPADATVGELNCAIPGCAAVAAIAPGPDGRLWFATGRTIAPFEPRPLALTVTKASGRVVREKDEQQFFAQFHCAGGAAGQECPGRIELRAGGRRLQTFRYPLASGSSGEEWIRLGASARSLLTARGRLQATLVASTGGRTTDTRPVTLVGAR